MAAGRRVATMLIAASALVAASILFLAGTQPVFLMDKIYSDDVASLRPHYTVPENPFNEPPTVCDYPQCPLGYSERKDMSLRGAFKIDDPGDWFPDSSGGSSLSSSKAKALKSEVASLKSEVAKLKSDAAKKKAALLKYARAKAQADAVRVPTGQGQGPSSLQPEFQVIPCCATCVCS
eukprot:CAMPEP_0175851508 /NCGR_PEP_ID=MMETSP0107_2-20121207/25695_1 /TAXON_ID=195067 ORGANISM="Goniomonas pacifica, Strain CCMP1869" /NCGR_SAMPLE_ID=MMETSP0107_2 /ASSEMBLY_ACC=CAM_ASM_000203 /LENGTH=177 /DNA_ID=CAMNT_0017166937 /DNA_START=20 /DNA_END=553 /DNA_ORIENTATION=-